MKFKRITASFLLIAFISTQHFSAPLEAAPELSLPQSTLPEKLSDVSIPESYGTVLESFQGNSRQTVFIVQDAHAIPEAQRNIQRLIGLVQKKYGIQLIAVEGAGGKFDPQVFRSFPARKALSTVFKQYQEKGELTGATAAAIFNKQPADYYGVESWELYDQGLDLFLLSAERQAPLLEKIKTWKKDLQERKAKLYSADLLKADSALQAFHSNQSDFAAVLQNLFSIRPPEKNSGMAAIAELTRNPSSAPDALLKAVHSKTDKEIEKAEGLNAAILHRYHQASQDYAVSKISAGEYAFQLKQTLKSHRLLSRQFAPEIRMLGEISSAYQKIHNMESTAVLKEFENYAQKVKESLIETPQQRALDRETRMLILIEKLARLELSREDWDAFTVSEKEDPVQWISGDDLGPQKDFYRNALARDSAFLNNLERARKASGNPDGAMLIAGGFHAQGLTHLLKKKQISYVMITPYIGGLPADNSYRRQMEGALSWSDYFKTGGKEDRLYDAFVRSTRDRLLRIAGPAVLKRWRDQIIRDLARKNEIEKAEEYTRFVDEALKEKKEQISAEAGLTEKLERLIAGLRNLKSSGALTPENIQGILKTGTLGAKYSYAVLDRTAVTRTRRMNRAAYAPVVPIQAMGAARFENRRSEPHPEWANLKKEYLEERRMIQSGFSRDYEKASKHNTLVRKFAEKIYTLAVSEYPEAADLAIIAFEKENIPEFPDGRILQNPDGRADEAADFFAQSTGAVFGKPWKILKQRSDLKVPQAPAEVDARFLQIASSSGEFPGSRFINGSSQTLEARQGIYLQFLKSLAGLKKEYETRRAQMWRPRSPENVETLMQGHADLADEMVLRFFALAEEMYPEQTARIALLVYGGQGRREMHLTSDSEGRLVLQENEEEVREAVLFLQNATEWIFGLGSRWLTLMVDDEIQMRAEFDDSLENQQNQLTIATELLDARFLGGNASIARRRLESFRAQLAAHHIDLTKGLIDVWNGRYKKSGYLEGLFVREPDVKDGTGGLRTMHYVRWIAQAYTQQEDDEFFSELLKNDLVKQHEISQAQDAYEFLNRVRGSLGRIKENQREPNRLTLDVQRLVAEDLGYTPSKENPHPEEQMLRDYYAQTLILFRFSYRIIRRISESQDVRPVEEIRLPEVLNEGDITLDAQKALRGGIIFQLSRGFRRLPKPRRFLVPPVTETGEVRGIRTESVMPILLYAAKNNLKLSGDLLDAVEKVMPRFIQRFNSSPEFKSETQKQFLELLDNPKPISYVMERLYLFGILSLMLPGFKDIGFRPHHELDYATTLDWHALQTLSALDRLMFEQPQSAENEKIPESVREFYNKVEAVPGLMIRMRLALLLQDFNLPETERAMSELKSSEKSEQDIEWFQVHQNDLNELIRLNAFWQGDLLPGYVAKEIGSDTEKWLLFIGASLASLAALRPEQFWVYLEAVEPALILEMGHSADIKQRIEHERAILGRITNQFVGTSTQRMKTTAVIVEPLDETRTDSAKITVFHRQIKDTPGRLKTIAGVLAANGVTVRSETVGTITENNDIINSFIVTMPPVSQGAQLGAKANPWQELEASLSRDLTDTLERGASVATIFALHRGKGAPEYASGTPETLISKNTKVNFDAEIESLEIPERSQEFSILRVETPDRPLLLFLLTKIIAAHGINIHAGSTIDTEGYDPRIGMKAVDTFFLSSQGRPLNMTEKSKLLMDIHFWLDQKKIDFKKLDQYMRLVQYKQKLEKFLARLLREPGQEPVKRIAYVGDIQGNDEKFKAVLRELKLQKVDQIIFAGDFIDRGKRGLAVMDQVRILVEQGRAVGVMGNHEMMFIEAMLSTGFDSTSFFRWVDAGGWDVLNEVFGDTIAGVNIGDAAVRAKINKSSAEFDDIFQAAKSNERLREMAEWMKRHLKLFYEDENLGFTMHARPKIDRNGNMLLDFEEERREPRPAREVLETFRADWEAGDKSRTVIRDLLNPHVRPTDLLFGMHLPEGLLETGLESPGYQNLLTQFQSLRINNGHVEPNEDPQEHLAISEKTEGVYNPIDYGIGKNMSGGYMISDADGIAYHLLDSDAESTGEISPVAFGYTLDHQIRQVKARLEATEKAIQENGMSTRRYEARSWVFALESMGRVFREHPSLSLLMAAAAAIGILSLFEWQRRARTLPGDFQAYNLPPSPPYLIQFTRFLVRAGENLRKRFRPAQPQEKKEARASLFIEGYDTAETLALAWAPWLEDAEQPMFEVEDLSTDNALRIEGSLSNEKVLAGKLWQVPNWGFSIKRGSGARENVIENLYVARFPEGVEPEKVLVGLLSWLKLRGFSRVHLSLLTLEGMLGKNAYQSLIDKYFTKTNQASIRPFAGEVTFELMSLKSPEPFVGEVSRPSESEKLAALKKKQAVSQQQEPLPRPVRPSVQWSERKGGGQRAVVKNENGSFTVSLTEEDGKPFVTIFRASQQKGQVTLYENFEINDQGVTFKSTQTVLATGEVIPDSKQVISLTNREAGPAGYLSLPDIYAGLSSQLDDFSRALQQAEDSAQSNRRTRLSVTLIQGLRNAAQNLSQKLEQGRERSLSETPHLGFEELDKIRSRFPEVNFIVYNKDNGSPQEISAEGLDRAKTVEAAWTLIDEFRWRDIFKGRVDEEVIQGGSDEGKTRYRIRLLRARSETRERPVTAEENRNEVAARILTPLGLENKLTRLDVNESAQVYEGFHSSIAAAPGMANFFSAVHLELIYANLGNEAYRAEFKLSDDLTLTIYSLLRLDLSSRRTQIFKVRNDKTGAEKIVGYMHSSVVNSLEAKNKKAGNFGFDIYLPYRKGEYEPLPFRSSDIFENALRLVFTLNPEINHFQFNGQEQVRDIWSSMLKGEGDAVLIGKGQDSALFYINEGFFPLGQRASANAVFEQRRLNQMVKESSLNSLISHEGLWVLPLRSEGREYPSADGAASTGSRNESREGEDVRDDARNPAVPLSMTDGFLLIGFTAAGFFIFEELRLPLKLNEYASWVGAAVGALLWAVKTISSSAFDGLTNGLRKKDPGLSLYSEEPEEPEEPRSAQKSGPLGIFRPDEQDETPAETPEYPHLNYPYDKVDIPYALLSKTPVILAVQSGIDDEGDPDFIYYRISMQERRVLIEQTESLGFWNPEFSHTLNADDEEIQIRDVKSDEPLFSVGHTGEEILLTRLAPALNPFVLYHIDSRFENRTSEFKSAAEEVVTKLNRKLLASVAGNGIQPGYKSSGLKSQDTDARQKISGLLASSPKFLKEVLYDGDSLNGGGRSLLGVLQERPRLFGGSDWEEASREIREERMNYGIIFAQKIRFGDLARFESDPGSGSDEYEVHRTDSVKLENLDRIFVPEVLWQAANELFPAALHSKMVRVANNRSVPSSTIGISGDYQVPDYETAIVEYLRSSDYGDLRASRLWLHAMRFYAPSDLTMDHPAWINYAAGGVERSELIREMTASLASPRSEMRELELSPSYVGTMVPQIPFLIQAFQREGFDPFIFGGAVRGLAFATQFDYALPISELDVAVPIARLSSQTSMEELLARLKRAKTAYHDYLQKKKFRSQQPIDELDLHISDRQVVEELLHNGLDWGISKFQLRYDPKRKKYIISAPEQAVEDLLQMKVRLMGNRANNTPGTKFSNPDRIPKTLDQAQQYRRFGFTVDPDSLVLVRSEMVFPRYAGVSAQALAQVNDLETEMPAAAGSPQVSGDEGRAVLDWSLEPVSDAERNKLREMHKTYREHWDTSTRDGFSYENEGAHFVTFDRTGVDWVLKAPKRKAQIAEVYRHLEKGSQIGGGIFVPYFLLSRNDLAVENAALPPDRTDLEPSVKMVVQRLAFSLQDHLYFIHERWADALERQDEARLTELRDEIKLLIKEWKKLVYRGWAMGIIVDDYSFENAGVTFNGDVLQLGVTFDESWPRFFRGSTSIADLANNVNRKRLRELFGDRETSELYGDGLDKKQFEYLWPSTPARPLESKPIAEDQRRALFPVQRFLDVERDVFFHQLRAVRGFDSATDRRENRELSPSQKKLKTKILAEIQRQPSKRITWEQFHRMSNFDPEFGYYTTEAVQFGNADDVDGLTFNTNRDRYSFAVGMGLQFLDMWLTMGRPGTFTILEQGGGDGKMASNILNFLRDDLPDMTMPLSIRKKLKDGETAGDFYKAVQYRIVDISPDLSGRQGKTLEKNGHAGKLKLFVGSALKMPFRDGEITGVLFSNELPDAFPVHRVIQRGASWKEIYVTAENGEFKEVEGDLTPEDGEKIERYLNLSPLKYTEGVEIAVNLDSFKWMSEAYRVLGKGYILTTDYGFVDASSKHAPFFGSSVYNFHLVNPLIPGIDLTHNIDFPTLNVFAQRLGFRLEKLEELSEALSPYYAAVFNVNEEEYVLLHSKNTPPLRSEMRSPGDDFVETLKKNHAQSLNEAGLDIWDQQFLSDPADVEPILKKVFSGDKPVYFADLGSWTGALLPLALHAGAQQAMGIEKISERAVLARRFLSRLKKEAGNQHDFLRRLDPEKNILETDFLESNLDFYGDKLPGNAERVYFYYVGSADELSQEVERAVFLEKLSKLPAGTKIIFYRMVPHFQFDLFELQSVLGPPVFEFNHGSRAMTRVYEVPGRRSETRDPGGDEDTRKLNIEGPMPVWYFLRAFGFDPATAVSQPLEKDSDWGMVRLPDMPEARRKARQSAMRVMLSETWLSQRGVLQPALSQLIQNPDSDLLTGIYLLTYQNIPAALVWDWNSGQTRTALYYPFLTPLNRMFFSRHARDLPFTKDLRSEVLRAVRGLRIGESLNVIDNPYYDDSHFASPEIHGGEVFHNEGISFPSIYPPDESSTRTLSAALPQMDLKGKTAVEFGAGNGRVLTDAVLQGAVKGTGYETSALGAENVLMWAAMNGVEDRVESLQETANTEYVTADIYMMNAPNVVDAAYTPADDFRVLTYEKARASNIRISRDALRYVLRKSARAAKPDSRFYLRVGSDEDDVRKILEGTGWKISRILIRPSQEYSNLQGYVYELMIRAENRSFENDVRDFARVIHGPVIEAIGMNPKDETELAQCTMCAIASPLVTKLAEKYFESDSEVKVELWGGVVMGANPPPAGQSPDVFTHFWTEIVREGKRYYISVMDGQLGVREWAQGPNVQDLSGLPTSSKYDFLNATSWRINSGNAEVYSPQRLYRKVERAMKRDSSAEDFGGYATLEDYLNSKVERIISSGVFRSENRSAEIEEKLDAFEEAVYMTEKGLYDLTANDFSKRLSLRVPTKDKGQKKKGNEPEMGSAMTPGEFIDTFMLGDLIEIQAMGIFLKSKQYSDFSINEIQWVVNLQNKLKEMEEVYLKIRKHTPAAWRSYSGPETTEALQKLKLFHSAWVPVIKQIDRLLSEAFSPKAADETKSSQTAAVPSVQKKKTANEISREVLLKQIRQDHGNLATVTRELKSNRSKIGRLVKQYGLEEEVRSALGASPASSKARKAPPAVYLANAPEEKVKVLTREQIITEIAFMRYMQNAGQLSLGKNRGLILRLLRKLRALDMKTVAVALGMKTASQVGNMEAGARMTEPKRAGIVHFYEYFKKQFENDPRLSAEEIEILFEETFQLYLSREVLGRKLQELMQAHTPDMFNGEVVKLLLGAAGEPLPDFAGKIGVNRVSLEKILREGTTPKAETLSKIAGGLIKLYENEVPVRLLPDEINALLKNQMPFEAGTEPAVSIFDGDVTALAARAVSEIDKSGNVSERSAEFLAVVDTDEMIDAMERIKEERIQKTKAASNMYALKATARIKQLAAFVQSLRSAERKALVAVSVPAAVDETEGRMNAERSASQAVAAAGTGSSFTITGETRARDSFRKAFEAESLKAQIVGSVDDISEEQAPVLPVVYIRSKRPAVNVRRENVLHIGTDRENYTPGLHEDSTEAVAEMLEYTVAVMSGLMLKPGKLTEQDLQTLLRQLEAVGVNSDILFKIQNGQVEAVMSQVESFINSFRAEQRTAQAA